ncbi:FxsA family protein [Aliamphritea spongicola]|nr:FxsA family protein [Aliamphritea spongicola]
MLFIIVPIIEITLLINVGQAIGAWNTVGLVLLSAFIGVNMLRYQGSQPCAVLREEWRPAKCRAVKWLKGLCWLSAVPCC